MKFKKVLILILSLIFTLTSLEVNTLLVFAAHTTAQLPPLKNNASYKNQTITFIVEVEGEPLAKKLEINASLYADKADILLKNQQMVLAGIQNRVNKNAKKGFVYTSVFNGFSVDGTIDQLDKIKALDGVKNVYVSSDFKAFKVAENSSPELLLDSAIDISNTDKAYTNGYKGEGALIAIIDAGCDTSHDFFKAEPENPKYTKDDIDELVKTLPLNAKAQSSNQVYKNAKIPYAYNYTESSTDTYIHTEPHGTHVAGIAAGKNGALPDGTLFSGVAPEAQLLVMSCATEAGEISMAATIAALNDAVLLGADVINMSFGIAYADILYDDVFADIFNKCLEAGVHLIGGSGNDGKGYMQKKTVC